MTYTYIQNILIYIYIHTYLFNDENYVFLFCSQSISDQKNIIYKKIFRYDNKNISLVC